MTVRKARHWGSLKSPMRFLHPAHIGGTIVVMALPLSFPNARVYEHTTHRNGLRTPMQRNRRSHCRRKCFGEVLCIADLRVPAQSQTVSVSHPVYVCLVRPTKRLSVLSSGA